MVKYLIAAHGELSKAFIDTSNLIIGPQENIGYFCMTKDKSGDAAEEEIRQLFVNKDKEERLIVLTDIYGGSVANIFSRLLMEGKEFDLITGVNLPMILSIILSTEKDTDIRIQQAIQEAKQGICYINDVIKNQPQEDDLDDFLS